MEELSRTIDHTLLKPEATLAQIEILCAEARQHHFKAVCVNSGYVKAAAHLLQGSDVLVASVVGFPLGAEISAAKAFETDLAISHGAAEIDMVIRIGALKEKNFALVEADIRAVVKAAGPAPVKVILETGLLETQEIREACKMAEVAGAQFVKTATGFLGRGALLDDIEIMKASCGLQIKASGGIKTFEQAQAFLKAGATRLGTSSGVALISRRPAVSAY